MATDNGIGNGEMKDSLVFGQTDRGVEIRASLLRLTRYSATFEVYSPDVVLRASEVFSELKIVVRDRVIYSGHAVVHNLVDAGTVLVCEVTLDANSWRTVLFDLSPPGKDNLGAEFREFVTEWQKLYLVAPEYKVIVADLQTFLTDLRLWLDQVELKISPTPAGDRVRREREVALELRESVIPAMDSLFDRFEEVSNRIEAELRPAHRAFGRRQLHPLFLCAPFMHRTFTKPLGYAGDYEMMNMIVRNGLEGNSLFAKLVNSYLLDQAPPHAVRNRIGFLGGKILDETNRVSRLGRTAHIFSVACGPAREVENFMAEHALSDHAQFSLLDFNEETLQHTGSRLEEVRKRYDRRTPIKLVKNAVQSLLKAAGRPVGDDTRYDLIYCSGLYDYLSDRVCKALNTYFYDRLQPGGLLVVGNFAPCTPRQNLMEHLLEWFLIYRDSSQLMRLAPQQASKEDCAVRAEPTGNNIFLEVRKPR